MNEKQAKALRHHLLPRSREEVGASCGAVFRNTTSYEVKQLNPQKPFGTLFLKPGTPRQVYQAAKRRYKRDN